MTLEEIKTEISNRTGIPAELLTGETAEENIAKAKALLAYKRECSIKKEDGQPKSTKQQFANWMQTNYGTEEQPKQDAETQALIDLENSLKAFPSIHDSTITADNIPNQKSAAEQFGEWAKNQFSSNPFNF